MSTPRRRGLPRVRYREVPPSNPPKPTGQWVVYVSFESEHAFALNFMVTHSVDDQNWVAARLPILILATLREQLLETHDHEWSRMGLPVNPVWHTDMKVLVGGNATKFRKGYVQRLVTGFNQACQGHTSSARMVMHPTQKPAPAPVKKTAAKKTAAKKTASKNTKKAVAKKAAARVPAKPSKSGGRIRR
ncbi:MAG TPA: hypothetical protein VJ843_01750 [Candidatus Saccharimonadales bacterium]|nr:hypothetical protein [Candidatus Saccharimonadales bacterium]